MTRTTTFLILFLSVLFSNLLAQTQVCSDAYFGITRTDDPSGLAFVQVDVETGAFIVASDYDFPNGITLNLEGIVDNQYFFVETIGGPAPVERSIVFIDLEDGQISNRIQIFGNIGSIIHDEAGQRLLYLQSFTTTTLLMSVSLIDGSINQVSANSLSRNVVSNSSFIVDDEYFAIRNLSIGARQIVAIDINTGQVTRTINLTDASGNPVTTLGQLFDYDPGSQLYYSITIDNSSSMLIVDTIDPFSGVLINLSSIPFDTNNPFLAFGSSGVINGQFYFVQDADDGLTLNFIDLSDGSLSSSAPIEGPLFHLQVAEICEDVEAQAIPTLSQWAIGLLSLLLLMVSVLFLRTPVALTNRQS